MSPPIVLILGAGPGIGASVASCFAAKGYSIVSAARSLSDQRKDEKHLELNVDLSHPPAIPEVFRKIEQELGAPPSVVIYNAAARTLVSADDPLSTLSSKDYERDMAVNLHSALVAAQEAVHGFARLPVTASRTYIYTGNKLNVMADPKVLAFGIARTGAAHFIWDCSIAYRSKGFKFYFTDERLMDGKPARELMDPLARGELYLRLSEHEIQGPWHYTYVKTAGYKDFRAIDKAWDVTPE